MSEFNKVRAVFLGDEGYAIWADGDPQSETICRSPIATIRMGSFEESKEWAERIVAAVNNHKALVEALRECITYNTEAVRDAAQDLLVDIDKEAS